MSELAGFWTPLALAGCIGLLAGLFLAWRVWARGSGADLDPLYPHPAWDLPWLGSLGREAWVLPDKAARRMLAEALVEHLSERAQVLLIPDPETPWTATGHVRMPNGLGPGGKHLLEGVRVLQNFGEVVLLLEGAEGLEAQGGAMALSDWMQKVSSPTVALLIEGEDLPGGSVRILKLSRTEMGLALGDGSEVLRQEADRVQLVTLGRE